VSRAVACAVWRSLACAAGLAAAQAVAQAPLVYTYVDRGEWIQSRALVIDDGREISVVGATATPAGGERLIRLLQRSSTSPLRRLIVDAATIDKAGGAAAFAQAGAEVWASSAVASHLPQVVESFAFERGHLDDGLRQLLELRLRTFERHVAFPQAGGSLEVLDVAGGCNAQANSVVRLVEPERRMLYVGAIIQPSRHPWFAARANDGQGAPGLAAWAACVGRLIDSGDLDAAWYSDEGPQAPGSAAAREFQAYLADADALTQATVSEQVRGPEDAQPRLLRAYAGRIALALSRRYPRRVGDVEDMARGLAQVLLDLVLRKPDWRS
jgi:hypothetical protein